METKKYKNFANESEYHKHYYKKNKVLVSEKTRNNTLKRLYGISLKQYNTMLEKQDSRCACCGIGAEFQKRRLAVDHNHTTGKIRELLCTKCNTIIANADESIEVLQLAIEYIKKHM